MTTESIHSQDGLLGSHSVLYTIGINFSFRKIVLPQINLVSKIFGDSTTDCVTGKILTRYLLKCKLSLVNSILIYYW